MRNSIRKRIERVADKSLEILGSEMDTVDGLMNGDPSTRLTNCTRGENKS